MSENRNSYLLERMEALRISDIRNTVELRNFHDKKPYHSKFFTEDKEGNICINYITPDGRPLLYDGVKQYVRTRFAPIEGIKLNGKSGKYKQPFGTDTPPFTTPLVLKSYKSSEQIDTLFITEGEFKAFALDNFGVPAIGIGGIFNYKEKEDNRIHHLILQIIDTCQVKNLVLLFDADCLSVEWKEGKDLWSRLNQFYRAVVGFNELVKPLNLDLYFAHVHEMHERNAKGIDDLLYHGDTNPDDVIKELRNLTSGSNRHYIKCLLITGNSNYNIQKYFSVDGVRTFFENYKSKLKGHDFRYKNENWYVDEKDALKISWYGEALSYKRVGCVYYKVINVMNAHENIEETLQEWNISEINRDYKNSKLFIEQIMKYDAFTNIPDHTKNYKRVIEVVKNNVKTRLYNRYNPVNHNIEAGEFPTIEKFLKHIFKYQNTKGESLYEFGLDYLQLLYTRPTLRLPVICLVSKEKNTGKSTFLEFLRLIFKENCTIMDNERFTGKFTSHFIDKLIIGIDEGFIPVEQKTMKERIKNMSTSRKQWFEAKGKTPQELAYFGKLVLCSNDENNFMQIDDDENRFAVIKIYTLTEDDPSILEKMALEIPYFLHFLLNRNLFHKGDAGRFWFSPSIYLTEAMITVAQRTKPRFEREFEDFMKEHFLTFKKDFLHYSATDIIKILKDERNYHFTDVSKIKEYLKDNKKGTQLGVKRYNVYRLSDDTITNFDDSVSIITDNKTGRPFEFYYEDWLDKKEIKQYLDTK